MIADPDASENWGAFADVCASCRRLSRNRVMRIDVSLWEKRDGVGSVTETSRERRLRGDEECDEVVALRVASSAMTKSPESGVDVPALLRQQLSARGS